MIPANKDKGNCILYEWVCAARSRITATILPVKRAEFKHFICWRC